MTIKKTEKHVSKKGGKGGYTYSVNLNSPSKIPATKQKTRREAKNTVVQIGIARPTDVEFPIRVSKKTREGLLRMANGEGVVKITEEDLMAAVRNYLRPKADKATIGDVLSANNVLFSQLPFTECDRAEIPKILDIAKEIIHGDREQTYGDPRFNLDTIARLWTVYLQRKFPSAMYNAEFTAEDVSQMMILLKTARLIHNPTHKDSLVDQAGYAALQGRINGL